MARPSIYSRSPARAAGPAPAPAAPLAAAAAGRPPASDMPPADVPPSARPTWRQRLLRHERWLWATGLVLAMLIAGWPAWTAKVQRPLGIDQIDAALRESIAKEPLQAPGLAAYEAVLPSVVRVVGEPPAAASAPLQKTAKGGKPVVPAPDSEDADPHGGRSVGTGVVIVDKGLILTNLHVVDGAAKITVTFSDGSQSEARVVNLMPENDLAVLQALTIPDDLHAATMRSTSGLAPGEAVMAVGFPFGIGPSASQGVVSGLKREFRSPEGRRILTNLIQFDAAANPGNSGGPLITMDGHVVGIVTAIMNPNEQRTFIGIGFAVPIENAAAGAGLPPF
ncbi:S1C family serine protease [Pseudaquabacterium pictum]|uniref:S1C family serine protease n=1 Tax=Pseudaquabacterium pictum TaxID=2315236 RepID=UPI0010FA3B54|nr:trypsin-like peptidase domain-containing protein [Rubrivivax pictus]